MSLHIIDNLIHGVNMGIANVGIVRAEGERVSTVSATDLILLQKLDSSISQYSPRMITIEDFLFSGLIIAEGTNAKMGIATLVAGTVTVSNTSVAANSRIFLSRQAANSATGIGSLSLGTVTASTSFVINSLASDATVETGDTSIVAWLIIQPAS